MNSPLQHTLSISDWNLLRGLSDDEVRTIVDASEKRLFKSGQTLCKQGETGESMFMILFGRVQMSVTRDDGRKQLLNMLHQGDHFGELTLLIGGKRTATATAAMDTGVLEISRDAFYQLLRKVPEFSINLSRTIGGWLRGELAGKITRTRLSVIGMVNTCPLTAQFAQQITTFFAEQNRRLTIFSDRADQWPKVAGVNIARLPSSQDELSSAKLRFQITGATEQSDHVLIDIESKFAVSELLLQCERVWWLTDQTNESASQLAAIKKMIVQEPMLKRRVQIVRAQPQTNSLLNRAQHTIESELEDLRIAYQANPARIRQGDLHRFYHAASGAQIGLALGGGGARGLAHVGVLAALEEHEIYFDRVAGTSAGAIIAAAFAAGFDQQYILQLFEREMTPPRWANWIPRGTKWHLISLFRFNLIEQRFRRYMHDYHFDQLLLPAHTVCVDLISGDEVIRSGGDVIDAVLESINHPLFGKPIYRDGEALVDGGVLNNVPSSVLRKYHADYVVSVDVGMSLSPKLGRNSAETKAAEMKRVGYFATLNRVLDVSHRGLAMQHASECDFLIHPDTSHCPFEDFTRGEQLFNIGYEATLKAIPELKQRYHEFISQHS
jgi:predicted acylesterase/phospholipase RssA/CRP-like cAMP-binding protein